MSVAEIVDNDNYLAPFISSNLRRGYLTTLDAEVSDCRLCDFLSTNGEHDEVGVGWHVPSSAHPRNLFSRLGSFLATGH